MGTSSRLLCAGAFLLLLPIGMIISLWSITIHSQMMPGSERIIVNSYPGLVGGLSVVAGSLASLVGYFIALRAQQNRRLTSR